MYRFCWFVMFLLLSGCLMGCTFHLHLHFGGVDSQKNPIVAEVPDNAEEN
jgi:hypothetical protein